MTAESPSPSVDPATDASWRGRTLRTREHVAPLMEFLRTETASSAALLVGIIAALCWANIGPASYSHFWATRIAVDVGTSSVSQSLHDFVNNGLMTLFFLVVGLEARREFDLGDLRDRRRFLLPMSAGIAGMVLPIGIYLAVNHAGRGAHGWGVAMSTDTALALGALSLAGGRVPRQARIFLLTVFVVDDIVALLVIAVFYSDDVRPGYLVAAFAVLAVYLGGRRVGLTRGPVFAVIGVALWLVTLKSGVDPLVVGLVIGLTAPAYTPLRDSLERATAFIRAFREQPTPELARGAIRRVAATQSRNARLQQLYLPWSSYAIVPLFALANTGIPLNGQVLRHAYTDPVAIGVIAAYLIGKPVAVTLTSAAVTRFGRGRIRPPVGWLTVLGSGTIAGVGFTVSLLVASRVFHGERLQDAKVGALTAAILAAVLTAAVYRSAALLPVRRRAAALLGDAAHVVDLSDPVNDADHIRGSARAAVTIVEYGDFECPYCGQAEPVLRRVLAAQASDVRYVWRHLPLVDVHPHAQLAAEAAEAAAAQDAFWDMHDRLLAAQSSLTEPNLTELAGQLGLDTERFAQDLSDHTRAGRVARDVESADVSGVAGTPTFFINGQRYHGAYDIDSLTEAVQTARQRAAA